MPSVAWSSCAEDLQYMRRSHTDGVTLPLGSNTERGQGCCQLHGGSSMALEWG